MKNKQLLKTRLFKRKIAKGMKKVINKCNWFHFLCKSGFGLFNLISFVINMDPTYIMMLLIPKKFARVSLFKNSSTNFNFPAQGGPKAKAKG